MDTSVSDFSHPFQQVAKAEAEGFDMSVKQLKVSFYVFRAEELVALLVPTTPLCSCRFCPFI